VSVKKQLEISSGRSGPPGNLRCRFREESQPNTGLESLFAPRPATKQGLKNTY
jgi:hypothetical protein